MNSMHKGLTAAATTTGLAVALTGSLLIAHPAAHASATPGTFIAAPMTLSALSTRLSHSIEQQDRRAERRLAQTLHRRRAHHRAARLKRTSHTTQSTTSAPEPSGTPQEIAANLVAARGWDSTEFNCLDQLWERESGWNVHADNPSSGAYGIPQALPGDKMATAGSDWQDSAYTQIQWGLGYIAASYGTPCAALSHSDATGYY
jgi:hypothetical protein